jgi:hypothetical protein
MKLSSVFGAVRIDTKIYASDAGKFAEVHATPAVAAVCVTCCSLLPALFDESPACLWCSRLR